MGASIAEGCGKQGNNEPHRFLYIASGSASELDYHLLLARDLKYLSDEDYRRMDQKLGEARRMLTALLQKVSADRFCQLLITNCQLLNANC
jgi:four helix bundle protein